MKQEGISAREPVLARGSFSFELTLQLIKYYPIIESGQYGIVALSSLILQSLSTYFRESCFCNGLAIVKLA